MYPLVENKVTTVSDEQKWLVRVVGTRREPGPNDFGQRGKLTEEGRLLHWEAIGKWPLVYPSSV